MGLRALAPKAWQVNAWVIAASIASLLPGSMAIPGPDFHRQATTSF
jgi:hypothetical protein